MKKITSALLLMGLFGITAVSCKKDNVEKVDSEEDIRSTKMTYKIDGAAKTSTHLFAVKDEGDIAIYGSIDDDETMVIAIEDFHGTGDYEVENDHVTIGYINGNTPTNSFWATEGVIKVTASTNNEVKGTFSGRLTNAGETVKEITEGKFEAKIVEGQD
ncbi:hypothetical protein [Pedobacter sp. SYSU D00535]|uniref:hypothetical protein n=1 Tax=Pedobacter sp. SYSU D00535 TaxID=2810308 RepID=UPI001A968034|nr:hypothetical protein [Pedobacter sp. SYSU D00535]